MDSANKDALAEYYHIPEIELLGRAKQAKARAGLMVKMYEHKDDGRIHPQFTQILSTARLACIAEGSKISCVNGLKNIEDIEAGDLVYCYDDEGQVQIRRVLNKYDNGTRECGHKVASFWNWKNWSFNLHTRPQNKNKIQRLAGSKRS